MCSSLERLVRTTTDICLILISSRYKFSAILPAVIVALTATDFLDSLDQWLNVLQAVQLPFALVPVLLFTNSEEIMGNFKNHRLIQLITWFLGLGTAQQLPTH